jgi:hypothetical protein
LGTGASTGLVTASIATTYAGTGFTSTTTAGTAVVGTLNTSGLSLGVPAYLTTADLSQNSSKYAGLGVTTATTAGTVVVGTLNTSGLSLGVPAYLTTADLSQNSSNYAGTGFTTATTAGTAVVGTFNTLGLNLGIPAYITSPPATFSYMDNIDQIANTATTVAQGSTAYVWPVNIDVPMSVSYARLLGSANFTGTNLPVSNPATSTAFNETVNWNLVLYSALSGANSLSLGSVTSAQAGLSWSVTVSVVTTGNTTNNNYTVTEALVYPVTGGTASVTTTYAAASVTIIPISTGWASVTGNVFLDVPLACSLSAGDYWLAFNRQSGSVGGKSNDYNISIYGVSQAALSFAQMGAASAASWCGPQLGLGSVTVAATTTSASLAFANITANASYLMPFIAFYRRT